jgi:hypothetical protein
MFAGTDVAEQIPCFIETAGRDRLYNQRELVRLRHEFSSRKVVLLTPVDFFPTTRFGDMCLRSSMFGSAYKSAVNRGH